MNKIEAGLLGGIAGLAAGVFVGGALMESVARPAQERSVAQALAESGWQARADGRVEGYNSAICAAEDLGILGSLPTEEFDISTDRGAMRADAVERIAHAKRTCND